MSTEMAEPLTIHIGKKEKNIMTEIQTHEQILVVRPKLDTSIGVFYFAMNKDRSLTSYSSRILAAIGKTRGPVVYLGGGWHPYPAESEESQDVKPAGEKDAPTYRSASQNRSQSTVRNPFNTESTYKDTSRTGRFTPTLVTHPPQKIIDTVERLDFEYYGIDPDIVGIQHLRKDTARTINVFEQVPDPLLGNTEWTPKFETLDDVDWSIELPDSAKEELKSSSPS